MTEQEQQNAREEAMALEWVLSTSQGRRVLWGFLSYCGIYRDIEGTSQHEIAKQIGRRQVGLHMLSLITDVSEDRLFEMMRESRERYLQEELNAIRSNDTITNYESDDSDVSPF